jgi:hypothetical protein
MASASLEEFTAKPSGAIEVPGPEILSGVLQLPVAEALVAAWISGVAVFDSQVVTAAPLGARAKSTSATLVSLPDTVMGDDHVLLLMEPLTAMATDVLKPLKPMSS